MKIKDIMCKNVKLVKPETTLRQAAQLMREHKFGYLPVGENDRITGAITDRDIVVHGIAANHNPDETMVKKIMTENITYCFEDDDVKDAAVQMKTNQVRRLVVLNRHKRLTGVVSVGDVARHCNDNHLTGDIEKHVALAA